MKKREPAAIKVRGIAMLLAISLTFVVTAFSGYGKYKEHVARSSSLEHYKGQARLITDEPLEVHFFERKGKKEEGLYFSTESGKQVLFTSFYGPEVIGYGGPIELLLLVDRAGELLDFQILKHYETPSWIRKIEPWMELLPGHSIKPAGSISKVDTVTGATYTTEAILKLMTRTGKRFYGSPTGEAESALTEHVWKGTLPFLLLLLMTTGALIIRFRPNRWVRRAFMLAVVAIFGLWLNLQFSSYHILALVGFEGHFNGFDKNIFYYIVMPITILLAGNIYCGYLCPFGQLQELISDLVPFKGVKVPPAVDRWARLLKYIFLLVLLATPLVAFLSPLLELDILLTVFTFGTPVIIGVLVFFLVLSIVSNRFWCKYLCPTGAWLSIMQTVSSLLYKNVWRKVPGLKKLYKLPHLKKCDLGVESVADNSCLCCDRCRYVK